MRMKHALLASSAIPLAIFGFLSPAQGQTTVAIVVASCPPTRTTPYVAGRAAPLTVDVNGILCTNATGGGGGGGTSSTFGAAFPATGTAVGMSQGGNMVAFTGTANSLNVNVSNANSNGQATMANSSPIVIASDQTVADPCMFSAKTNLAISQNGTASVQLIALSGSTSINVCSLSLIGAGATTVALTTGTGSACGTGTAAILGSTTVANALSFAANGGLTYGNGGGTVAKGAASGALCMLLGSNVFVSGNLTYVQR